jgi:hypothetical protein
MMKHLVWLLAIMTVFATASMAQQSAEINLAGYKHVPPVATSGSGVIQVTLQSDTLYVEGRFQDLVSNYRSSSIHYGSEQESGNRLMGLKVQLNEDRRSGVFRKEENYFELRPSMLEALSQGHLYISIASDRQQRGEIRAQIPPMQ